MNELVFWTLPHVWRYICQSASYDRTVWFFVSPNFCVNFHYHLFLFTQKSVFRFLFPTILDWFCECSSIKWCHQGRFIGCIFKVLVLFESIVPLIPPISVAGTLLDFVVLNLLSGGSLCEFCKCGVGRFEFRPTM